VCLTQAITGNTFLTTIILTLIITIPIILIHRVTIIIPLVSIGSMKDSIGTLKAGGEVVILRAEDEAEKEYLTNHNQ
jgi:hypothetical protein